MGWNDLFLEAYKDLLQPTVRQVGHDVQAIYCNRLAGFRERVIGKVPQDRRIKAHIQIAGPILEGLKYVEEDGIIAEMFLNLLSRAIDKERVSEAHPAFSEIIKHLSPDEAIILYNLKQKPIEYIKTSTMDFPYGSTSQYPGLLIGDLIYKENYGIYMEHLATLNLVKTTVKDPDTDIDDRGGTTIRIKRTIFFTEFGELFARACVPDKFPVSY